MKSKSLTCILPIIIVISFFSIPSISARQSAKSVAKETLIFDQRGWELFQEGRYREAAQNFDLAILHNPKDDYAYALRSCCNAELNNIQGCFADITKAIEINPKNGKYWWCRGLFNEQMGYYQAATNDLIAGARMGEPLAQSLLRQRGISW